MKKFLFIFYILCITLNLFNGNCAGNDLSSSNQIASFNRSNKFQKIEILEKYLPGKVFISPPNIIFKFITSGKILSTCLGKDNVYISYWEIKNNMLLLKKKDDNAYVPISKNVEIWSDFNIKEIISNQNPKTISFEYKINNLDKLKGYIIVDITGKYDLIFELFERKMNN